MKTSIVLACAAIALGAAIASCGGSSNVATTSATPTPVPTPSTACTSPASSQIQVVYPQPNAANVTTGTVVIAVAPTALPTNATVYVQVYNQNLNAPSPSPTGTPIGTAFGTTLQVIPVAQLVQFPGGTLSPPFANPTYEQATFGGIFGSGLYFQVYLGGTNCYPGTSLLSGFST
jgi:hypothetical protein